MPENGPERNGPNTLRNLEEGFGAREYVQTYYPNDLDVEGLSAAAARIRESHEKQSNFDIADIAKELGISHETVENLAVLDFQRMIARNLLAAFPRGDAKVLDIGGGPTVYQHMAISLSAGHITHSDFLERNRQEALRWFKNEEGAHNWDGYFKLLQTMVRTDPDFSATLEAQSADADPAIQAHARYVREILNEASVDGFKRLVRERVGDDVVYANVFAQNLDLPAEKDQKFDVVTSYFAVEGATADKNAWAQGMKNMLAHVGEPPSFFIQASVRNAEWYEGGKDRLPATKVTEKEIRDLCAQEGFEVIEQRILTGTEHASTGYDGMIFTFAKRI